VEALFVWWLLMHLMIYDRLDRRSSWQTKC